MSNLADAVRTVLQVLPRHAVSLAICHNEHRAVHLSAASYANEITNWASDAERELAISNDEIWEMQWYPDTPVGSYRLGASSLLALLRAATEPETP